MIETMTVAWRILHPWQRNQVIATMILGETSLLCVGKLVYDGFNTLHQHHYYWCQDCRTRLIFTEAFFAGGGEKPGSKPNVHSKYIPRYSENLDDAWHLFQHFAQLPEEPFEEHYKKQLFFEALEVWPCDDPSYYNITLPLLASWTPEKICLAALTAYGIEVQ